MPRIYSYERDPIDYCTECMPDAYDALIAHGGLGEDPAESGFAWDAEHPPYSEALEGEEYECEECGEILTDKDHDAKRTPLIAAFKGKTSSEMLLNAAREGWADGIATLAVEQWADANCNEGEALMLAADAGDRESVELLLELGADPNARDGAVGAYIRARGFAAKPEGFGLAEAESDEDSGAPAP